MTPRGTPRPLPSLPEDLRLDEELAREARGGIVEDGSIESKVVEPVMFSADTEVDDTEEAWELVKIVIETAAIELVTSGLLVEEKPVRNSASADAEATWRLLINSMSEILEAVVETCDGGWSIREPLHRSSRWWIQWPNPVVDLILRDE